MALSANTSGSNRSLVVVCLEHFVQCGAPEQVNRQFLHSANKRSAGDSKVFQVLPELNLAGPPNRLKRRKVKK